MKLKDLFEIQNYSTRQGIKAWLKSEGITSYIIRPDLSVDVISHVNIRDNKLTELPVKFNNVEESFECMDGQLRTLKNSPRRVGARFYCYNNRLKSFVGGPEWVGSDFHADANPIVSFEGAPKYIGGEVNIENIKMISLRDIHKHFKEIRGIISIGWQTESHILGIMLIKEIEGIEKKETHHNRLGEAIDIINKHLRGDRNIHDAQEELIEAGLPEYAKL